MFLPEIMEEDEEETYGRKTPKSSILSLHNVGHSVGPTQSGTAPSGPTEGTWR